MGNSILELIGNTPLVEIRSLNPNPDVKILAKLEYCNPGGSIKDRAALYMIEAGEKSGELTPGKIVIEATSGNTGIGLAMICAIKGYKLLLTMSEAASIERRNILMARGAEILLTPGHMGTDGAIEEVYRLARENPDKYFMTDQYNNEANVLAHYETTGQEIWQQTEGWVSTLVATIGTSGTIMGTSRRLKEYNPDIMTVAVEPYLGHKIQGLKNMKEAYCPGIFNKNGFDRKVNVEDELAFDMTRRLAREEGLFVGMSSGAAMAVACEEAKKLTEGTIVVIFPDSGERYLSTTVFKAKDTTTIQLYNTMSRTKETFVPKVSGSVSIYSCGPTVHRRINMSEARRFVFSDILCRYLDLSGFKVNHVMNITDLDDKTIAGANDKGLDLSEFTTRHVDYFEEDAKSLGIKPANEYPRASEYVDDMVKLCEQLSRKGYAYEKLRSLYFDISKLENYGRLSAIDLNKMHLGATVDLEDYEKDNPRDFTLLKRTTLSDLKKGIYYKTKWGSVRPSWHIQCPAMSMGTLGTAFDIHTGSQKLIFPHHENEIAIAMALTGKSPANFWMHCGPVLFDGKEEREDGFMMLLQDLLDKGYSGKEIRFWLMSTHYRKPIAYTAERLEVVRKSIKRLNNFIHVLYGADGSPFSELGQLLFNFKTRFRKAMDDDLNISAALAAVFSFIKEVNTLLSKKILDKTDASKILAELEKVDEVLKIMDIPETNRNANVKALLNKREQARKNKDWESADRIRSELQDKFGIQINDQRVG